MPSRLFDRKSDHSEIKPTEDILPSTKEQAGCTASGGNSAVKLSVPSKDTARKTTRDTGAHGGSVDVYELAQPLYADQSSDIHGTGNDLTILDNSLYAPGNP